MAHLWYIYLIVSHCRSTMGMLGVAVVHWRLNTCIIVGQSIWCKIKRLLVLLRNYSFATSRNGSALNILHRIPIIHNIHSELKAVGSTARSLVAGNGRFIKWSQRPIIIKAKSWSIDHGHGQLTKSWGLVYAYPDTCFVTVVTLCTLWPHILSQWCQTIRILNPITVDSTIRRLQSSRLIYWLLFLALLKQLITITVVPLFHREIFPQCLKHCTQPALFIMRVRGVIGLWLKSSPVLDVPLISMSTHD